MENLLKAMQTNGSRTDQNSYEKNCNFSMDLFRSQSYNNVSIINGTFKGVKTRILQETPEVFFPCSAHSLVVYGVINEWAVNVSIVLLVYYGY